MARKDYTPAEYKSPKLETIELGPAMRALSEREQAIVGYLVDTGTDSFTEACQAAGYSKDGSYNALRVTASHKRRDPRIQAAIREVTAQLPATLAPMALRTLATQAADPAHKDANKAATTILAMSGISAITKTENATTVTHSLDPVAAIEAKLAMLPKEDADLLRSRLLPRPVIIDVTPAKESAHGWLGQGECDPAELLDQTEVDELLADL